MYNIYLPGCIFLLCIVSVHLKLTFDDPPAEGDTVTIAEDKAVSSSIYTLQATDPGGNVPKFSILTQDPETPSFRIDANDNLIVPSQGLDAEDTTMFNITFRVSAGSSSADSGLLTVRVTDVNDNDPTFNNTPYSGEIWKNEPAGTYITTVTANDPDISNLSITYSIAGAQTTFSVNGSGVISLATAAGLASLSSPTVLQIQASDGGRTSTAAVNININDDLCTIHPCQNGGTCTSYNRNGTTDCTCLSGYSGTNCESVDYCYQDPCVNGSCTNSEKKYLCYCEPTFFLQNCTEKLECNDSATRKNESIDILVGLVDGSHLYRPIRYSANITFTPEEGNSNFTLNGTHLIAPHGLDAEDPDLFNITFTFTIQIEQANISCPFTLYVDDINDNSPEFNQSEYTAYIRNGTAAGTFIIRVTATDRDRDPVNRNISYSLTGTGSELFSIDTEACITSLTATFPATMYIITVNASDGTYTAYATVNIHVNETITTPSTPTTKPTSTAVSSSSTTVTTFATSPTSKEPTGSTTSKTTVTTPSTTQTGTTSSYTTTTITPSKTDWQLILGIGFFGGCLFVILIVFIVIRTRRDNGDTKEEFTNMCNQSNLNNLIDEMLNIETGINISIHRGVIVITGHDIISWLKLRFTDQVEVQQTASLLIEHCYIKALGNQAHLQVHQTGSYVIQLELIVDRMIHEITGVPLRMSGDGPVFTGQNVLEWLMNRLRIRHKDDAVDLVYSMCRQKELHSVNGNVDVVELDRTDFMFGLHLIDSDIRKTGQRFNGRFIGKDLVEWLLDNYGHLDEALTRQTCKRLLHHSFITSIERDVSTFELDKWYMLKERQEPQHGYRKSAYMLPYGHRITVDENRQQITTF